MEILPPEVQVVATDTEDPYTYKWSATEVKPQATPLAVPTYPIHGF